MPEWQFDRAPRYAVQAPLRYRRVGDSLWLAGASCNLSTSGLLFAGERALPPGTTFEFAIALRKRSPNSFGSSLVGAAIVMRCSPASVDTPFVAAEIVEIKLVADSALETHGPR